MSLQRGYLKTLVMNQPYHYNKRNYVSQSTKGGSAQKGPEPPVIGPRLRMKKPS